MESITLYEVRVIEKNEINRRFAKNLDQLFSLVKEVENKKCYVFKIYKSSEGNILSSERLDCKIRGNNFVIKTVKNKPIRNRNNRGVRKFIEISTFKIAGKETSSPKILSHFSRKPHILIAAPRRPKLISQNSFGRNYGRKKARLQFRNGEHLIRPRFPSQKLLLRKRTFGLAVKKFRVQPGASHPKTAHSRMKTDKNLKSKVSRSNLKSKVFSSAPTPHRSNSGINKSGSPYRRK